MASEHHLEIFRLEGQAHPEHDHPEQRVDEPGLQVTERAGEKQGGQRRQQHQHAHIVRDEFAEAFHR